jgi:hypothetical protein
MSEKRAAALRIDHDRRCLEWQRHDKRKKVEPTCICDHDAAAREENEREEEGDE